MLIFNYFVLLYEYRYKLQYFFHKNARACYVSFRS